MGHEYIKPVGFLIFSVERAANDPFINAQNHAALLHLLKSKSIPHREIDGKFNGINEQSIVVGADYENVVIGICQMFEQDCYLYVNTAHNNEAWLRDCGNGWYEGGETYIGRFKSTCSYLAEKYGDYSHDPKTDQHHVCIR